MATEQITAADIAGWDSLRDIADSFEKRGLKRRESLGEDNELVLQLADDEFVVLVEAGPGESATDFQPENRSRHTNLVATNDFEDFTFLTRTRSWEGQQHGRIKYQKISFAKTQFTRESGEKNTVLQKLNSIEYGSSAAIYDTLYDTQQVVKEFYEDFEALRTDLVQEVSGICDDRGDAKQRYVQVVLDRMIFLYFIQEKRLLDRNPNYLHEQPGKVVGDGEDRYDNFYRPLFFDYLAEDKQNPEFGSLPYLNGGLFAKNPVEEDFPDAKLGTSAKQTNEFFDDILDFLSDWNWNVDERLDIVDPKNLSPAILGHIFEQTVNQKEMGAYYTPEEITGFMSRRTIHPYLLDQLNDAVDAEYDEIDDVFGFASMEASGGEEALADGGTMTQQVPSENVETKHVETLYHDILKEAHILDPAVGSGAFLLAAQDVLVDIYMQCIEFFQQLEQEGKGWELESRTRDELEDINAGQGGASLYAKRTVILNNLYGVDIDEGAVEICKLRLWLSMVADIEDEPNEVNPLPNIDFNIRQGNTLIGYVNELEEAVAAVNDEELVQSTIGSFGKHSVKQAVKEISEAIENHKTATSSEKATEWRHKANKRLERYREVLDEKVLNEFQSSLEKSVSLDDIKQYSPFHWVIEFPTVFQQGGFDVAIGNPPWDKVKSERTDFFPKYDPVFRRRSDNKKDKDAIQKELLNDPEIKKKWEEYTSSINRLKIYYKSTEKYKLQTAVVDGRTLSGDQEKSTLFLERVFSLVNSSGFVTQILPGILFSGGSNKSLRHHLIKNTKVNHIIGFENKGIFEGVHDSKKFAIVTFKNSGESEGFDGVFMKNDVSFLRDVEKHLVWIKKELLLNFAPESGLFPFIRSETHRDVLTSLLQHPELRDQERGGWYLDLYRELDRTNDRDRFITNPEKGDYPVFGGDTIYQFIYDDNEPEFWSVTSDDKQKSAKWRIREKNKKNLKTEIYNTFEGTGSQKAFVNKLLKKYRNIPLREEDVLLDCSEYRLVYRHTTGPANERTLVVSVIPKGVVCHNALTTMRPYEVNPTEEALSKSKLHDMYDRIFTDRELFAAAGLLNSIPIDYLMKSKVEENVNMFHILGTQVPRLTEGDDWFEYISERAARLNCYGDEFKEIRERLGGIQPVKTEQERRSVQAELDAAALHACGLEESEVEFVLADFTRVRDPRMMDEDYFELVLDKYQSLQVE